MFFNRTAMDRLDYVTRESQRKVTTAQSGKILEIIFDIVDGGGEGWWWW